MVRRFAAAHRDLAEELTVPLSLKTALLAFFVLAVACHAFWRDREARAAEALLAATFAFDQDQPFAGRRGNFLCVFGKGAQGVSLAIIERAAAFHAMYFDRFFNLHTTAAITDCHPETNIFFHVFASGFSLATATGTLGEAQDRLRSAPDRGALTLFEADQAKASVLFADRDAKTLVFFAAIDAAAHPKEKAHRALIAKEATHHALASVVRAPREGRARSFFLDDGEAAVFRPWASFDQAKAAAYRMRRPEGLCPADLLSLALAHAPELDPSSPESLRRTLRFQLASIRDAAATIAADPRFHDQLASD